MSDLHRSAEQHIRQLAKQLALPSAAITVAARTSDTTAPDIVIDLGRYDLSRSELRADIAEYTGQLQAPRFAGVAIGALAASASRFDVDVSGRYTPQEQAIAEHLRRLSVEWTIRNDLTAGPKLIQAAADTLWQPTHFSDENLLLFALLELLPRVDAGILPKSAAEPMMPAAAEHIGIPRLREYASIWRAAILARPNRAQSPTPADWLTAARAWIGLVTSDLPSAAASLCANEPTNRGFGTTDRSLSAAPTGEPLAQQISHDLQAISLAAQQHLAAVLRTIRERSGPEGSGIATVRAKQSAGCGAGGAVISGDRTITYRKPTSFDETNRRTFARELHAAGYRQPGMAMVPVAYPAGRLNTRALIAQQAQIAKGLPSTATPWTARRMVANRSQLLQFALVVDASATMSSWVEVVAPTGWALAHAIHSRGGVCSVWGFAGEPFEIIPAGTVPVNVPVVRDSGSGSAGAAQAMAAAYGEIRKRDGARVVVVLTDGKLPAADAVDIDECIEVITGEGAHVLWVLTSFSSRTSLRPRGATVIERQTPTSVSEAIVAATFGLLAHSAHK